MAEISLNQVVNKYCQYLIGQFGAEAILEHLEDLEDIRLADEAMQRIQDGKEEIISLEEFIKEYEMEN